MWQANGFYIVLSKDLLSQISEFLGFGILWMFTYSDSMFKLDI
jgi:hypothetical protein